jgi:cytidine deaminase
MSVREELIAAARRARKNAYAPYSTFSVGAAIRSRSRRAYKGCNVENSTFGLSVCAERVALWNALSAGERDFELLAVVADTDQLTPPCGACRQILWEFCGDLEILLANLQGRVEVHRLAELMPRPFDARFLRRPGNRV